jgi:hypothetical protein
MVTPSPSYGSYRRGYEAGTWTPDKVREFGYHTAAEAWEREQENHAYEVAASTRSVNPQPDRDAYLDGYWSAVRDSLLPLVRQEERGQVVVDL